jgi:hypothetical protein
MNLDLIIILIFLFVIFIVFFPKKKREDIKFPFRAIAREMPTEIIVKLEPPPKISQPSPQPPAQLTQSPSSTPPSQNYSQYPSMSQEHMFNHSYYNQPHIREIYPVPFMRGDEYKKNYMRGTIGLRDIDRPFQDITTEFIRVGTVYSENNQDDTVMTLYRRDISPERDLYEYKVVDKTNGNDIELFLSTNINFLRNGDKIIIPGYENKGNFIVNLDTRYRYTMLRPFY